MQSFTPQPAPQTASQPTPMNAPAETTTEFAPMPLRARGVLEQLDLAVKVYRRYLGVLLSWSALVLGAGTIIGLFGLVLMRQSLTQASQFSSFPVTGNEGAALAMLESFSRLSSIFLLSGVFIFLGLPLIFGSVACAATAAVRGQRIEFEQCWSFTKPRYGGMILQIFLSILVGFLIAMGVSFAFGIIIVVGGLLIAAVGRSASALAIIVGIIGGIALYLGLIVLFMAIYLWFMMIPIIACMEDNRRSSGAIGRSSTLMRGGWWRAAGLMLLVGIAIWIAQAVLALIGGVFISRLGTAAQMSIMFLIYMAMYTLITPFYATVAAIFYLDQRVRHEALDLEWASYAGSETDANSAAPSNEYANASFSTPQTGSYAPASAPQNYSPTPTLSSAAPRTYAGADNNPFDASTEDLASMSLDDLMPKKKLTPDEIARAQSEAVAAMGLPQVPGGNATFDTPTQNQTQILPNDAAAPTDNFASNVTSSTRNYDEPMSEQQNDTSSQIATKTCAQCGAAVTETQNFCLTCGARL